jgi:phosphatidylserine/phosphatidylglycerophosphate/cardiolipin synthase-like enzyme
MSRLATAIALLSTLPLFSCGPLEEVQDVEEEGEVSTGKADGLSLSACQITAVLALVNDAATGVEQIRGLGITSSVAKAIVAHRDGPDAQPGTPDDDPFDDLAELDAVKYVGPKVLGRLASAVEDRCATSNTKVDVVFSPQPYDQSHLPRVAAIIDGAKHSLDVAMYSFSDGGVQKALERAVQRGLKVRFIYEEGGADSRKPEGSRSLALENAGVNVRYVNKIMHHKVLIADGPRDDLAAASTATLVTGSANWSNGAATKYDENTLFITGLPRQVLAYQAEFNLLWEHSSDFVGKPLPYESSVAIDRATLPADGSIDAFFTSDNFTAKAGSTTFSSISGKSTISGMLVKEIQAARTSIHISSGHLRARAVSEALMAAKKQNPALDIKVYLDGQEYISDSTHAAQVRTLNECVTAAGSSVAKQQDCLDRGFLFSYQVSTAGIPLKFKYYAYRWDASYAKQMHNKYFIFDGKTLVTGSYNLSDNAEHNTFENMTVLRAPTYSAVIDKFEESFAKLWVTGEDAGLLASLTDKVKTAPVIPIVFDPMALTWKQVTDLKQLIAKSCPAVNSVEYRSAAPSHQVCTK